MKNPTSELLSSLLLGFVALIPNHTFRYTVLATLAGSRHRLLNPPQISDARWYSPPKLFHLAEQMRRLHEVAKKASSVKCHILKSESESFSWNRFRALSSDIGECTKNAENICTAVELILEAERQRKLAYDIMEIQFALTAA
ncbi:hypothetical protein B0H14DRAFT_3469466 [Mycena olivaceomarginata]|nr:hypothetical protein B0H14DRAFT_3469466 [Mycena olivaceomarginata]